MEIIQAQPLYLPPPKVRNLKIKYLLSVKTNGKIPFRQSAVLLWRVKGRVLFFAL